MIEQIFVGRETELEVLKSGLEKVQGSQECQAYLIEGNAGTGKTSLIENFAKFIVDEYEPKAFVAIGKCNEQTGITEAYLPFREILNQLTGIQSRMLRSSLNTRPAGWLRNFLDGAIPTLIEYGPDLIGTFVPGTALMARIASTTINTALKKRAESRAGNQEIKKEEVREQYSAILRRFSKDTVIILIIDDLQWADKASLDLFTYLIGNLTKHPVLIIGTYRSEDKEKHLIDIKHDLQAQFGDIVIDLDDASRKRGDVFTKLFLSSHKAQLDDLFQEEFYRRTEGNALFSVELFRYLCENKLLIKNDTGYWVPGSEMDWNRLPPQLARLEGLIDARFQSLSPELRQILDIASIEGQNFTAQVIMNFLNVTEFNLLRTLSAELEKRHNLVSEVREFPVGGNVLTHYRFVNATFHQYIYHDMSLGQRRLRHKEVAETLEKLYGSNCNEIAFQLARHYELSYQPQKVVQYLNMAGEQIAKVSDYKDAESVLDKALSLAKMINDKRGHVDSVRHICGAIWIPQEKNEEAESQLLEALDLTRHIGHKIGEIHILRQLGILARRRRHFTTATRYYLESLEIAKKAEFDQSLESSKVEIKNAQAQALNNLGSVAMAEKAYQDAETYFLGRLKIADELNLQAGKLMALLNLGDLFVRKGFLSFQDKKEETAIRQWLLSRNYLCQALEIGHSTGAKSQIASIKRSLGDISVFEKKYGEAQEHLHESLSIVLDRSINSKIMSNLASTSHCLYRMGEIKHASNLACFIINDHRIDEFYKEVLKGVIDDVRKNYPSINVDDLLEKHSKTMKNNSEFLNERLNLAKTTLKMLKSKDENS